VRRFYFDHNATTPISPQVLAVYTEALRESFGNASSIHHEGQAARHRLEAARRQVAVLLGCNAKETVFLSGGTEANNAAIFGSVAGHARAHVITTSIEHPAVLEPCRELQRRGIEVTYVPVGATGVVNPEDIRRSLRPDTVLISVMHVNNETGTIQPIAEIARLARESGILMHSDGVQGAGRIPVDLRELGVDFYTITAHKMYSRKGMGALFIRKGTPFRPLILGGAHESRRRAGTEDVPGAAAFGEACRLSQVRMNTEAQRTANLRDRLPGGSRNEWAVPVADARGGEHTVIHQFDNSHGAKSWRVSHPHPVFSPDGKRVYFNVSDGEWTRLHVAEVA